MLIRFECRALNLVTLFNSIHTTSIVEMGTLAKTNRRSNNTITTYGVVQLLFEVSHVSCAAHSHSSTT